MIYNNHSILAVVPARGGSKGIKLKNLRPVNGVPLVAMVGHVVQQLPYLDRAVVSTDHPEIARVAQESGLHVPFYRPQELSADFVGDWDVLHHALTTMEEMDDRQYDMVIMLQPTSPLRKPGHVTQTIEKLIDGHFDSVITVSQTDTKNHPYKQLTLENDHLDYYDERGKQIIARQQLSQLYHRNGICYAITRQCLFEHKSVLTNNSSAVVIDDPAISIDTEEDIQYVEYILNAQPQQ